MKICPYLGLQQDPKTPAIFPTERNFCYNARPARAALDTHQQEYCLSDSHTSCPVFRDASAAAESVFFHDQKVPHRQQGIISFLLAFLVFLGAALAVWFYRESLFGTGMTNQPQSLSLIPTPLQTEKLEQTTTPNTSEFLATVIFTPTTSPRPTDTPPPPTSTASVTPPPGLGWPIGSDPALAVHRVASGESLSTISALYGTTDIAIRAVNLNLPIPLWENWLVIVPFQTQDVDDLPLFEAYQVTADGVTVAELARQLNVDAQALAQYNNLEQDNLFAKDQWVLVPHTRP